MSTENRISPLQKCKNRLDDAFLEFESACNECEERLGKKSADEIEKSIDILHDYLERDEIKQNPFYIEISLMMNYAIGRLYKLVADRKKEIENGTDR